MGYVTGFVLAVPTANRETYRDHATRAWPLFRGYGALRMTEAWGDNVPDGKVTDFKRAVNAKADETVVFSWIEWKDKAAADSAWAKMQDDPEMANLGDMPFDGQRMIFGGFETIVEVAAEPESA